MDILGDIFRGFVLAQAYKVAIELQNKMIGTEDFFLESFVYIVEYSYQPGHSKKLVRMILIAMNASTVNSLRRKLSERQRAMTDSTTNKVRAFTNVALKCIQGIQTPLSLQALARLVMSTRSTDNEALSTSKIPVHLKKYVLYQEY